MKPPPDNLEFANFTAAMKKILTVSKVELNRRLDAEKKRKTKSSAFPVPASSSTSTVS